MLQHACTWERSEECAALGPSESCSCRSTPNVKFTSTLTCVKQTFLAKTEHAKTGPRQTAQAPSASYVAQSLNSLVKGRAVMTAPSYVFYQVHQKFVALSRVGTPACDTPFLEQRSHISKTWPDMRVRASQHTSLPCTHAKAFPLLKLQSKRVQHTSRPCTRNRVEAPWAGP